MSGLLYWQGLTTRVGCALMARPRRIAYPGAVYHGTGWGIKRNSPPRRAQVQARCRAFVRAGRQAWSLWRELGAQSILGEVPFADRLSAQIRGHACSAEMPKRLGCAARPPLHRPLGPREGLRPARAECPHRGPRRGSRRHPAGDRRASGLAFHLHQSDPPKGERSIN